jgi:transcription elongation GreA/GreB family factor
VGQAGKLRVAGCQPDIMDKEQIVQAILEKLRIGFEADQTTSKMTRAASNDAETKSEGKYDTRSTEENYLADGLAKKALAAAQAAKEFKDLAFEEFSSGQEINLGALVKLSFDDGYAWFFLGPAAGGIEIEYAGELVTVITIGSPLGKQILGKKVGDLISAPKAKIELVQ